MWSTFALAVALGVFSLYVPGYLIARAVRIGRFPAVVAAPLISIFVFNVLALAYRSAGVGCSWLTVVLPVVVVGAVAFAANLAIFRKTYRSHSWGLDAPAQVGDRLVSRFNIYVVAAYVAMGVLVTVYVMVSCLDGPSSYVQEFDNVHHLDMIKNFAVSGQWSVFSTDYYRGAAYTPFATSGGGFYPTSWIMIAAMICDTLGTQPALAENAANFAFIAFVLPVSMFGLMRYVFRAKPAVALCGIVCTLAFSAYPWQLLSFGPIYPNLAAYALVPAVSLFFMLVFKPEETRAARTLSAAVVFVGVASLALTQPNAVFTAVVLLVPWCMYAVAKATDKLSLEGTRKIMAKIGAAAGFFVFAALMWALLLHAPFLQGVLSEWWYAYTSQFQSIADAATLQFVGNGCQPLLALFVALGVLYAVLRREYLWLIVPYALFCFMFVIDASTEYPLKLWLTGFWYTDKFRIAAAAALCGVPLACMGLYAVCSAVRYATGKAARSNDRIGPAVAVVLVVALVTIVNYYPNWIVNGAPQSSTAFGLFRGSYEKANSSDESRPYNKDEQAFVEHVKEVLPEGEPVINVPHDGSAFAFSQNDLNIFYRSPRGYDPPAEKVESAIVRESLFKVASDDEVAQAVDALGVKYVLLLDVNEYAQTSDTPFLFAYEEPVWKGITSINDETPGFETVLSSGDMRLYKIAVGE